MGEEQCVSCCDAAERDQNILFGAPKQKIAFHSPSGI
jgi:hypothetical protein